MSADTTLALIKQRMTEFKTELLRVLNNVTGRAEHADTADKLEGNTPAQVKSLLSAEVTKHTQKLTQGVHKIAMDTLGTYSKAQFDSRLDKLVDLSGDLPISFYGDREYIPPPISGSFESGTNLTPWSGAAMLMEDNGTLMVLRTGTDGDTSGIYYSYLKDAHLRDTQLSGFIHTNARYSPAYFPGDQYASQILYGGQDVVIGILSNKVTRERTGYFISLTNNTFDMSKHTGVVIPLNNNAAINPQISGAIVLGGLMGYVKDGVCYLLQDLNASSQLGFRVWSISVNALISGVYPGLTREAGWTVNRGTSGIYTGDDLLLYNSFQETAIITGKPVYIIYPANGTPCGNITVDEQGVVSVMISHMMTFATVDDLSGGAEFKQHFAFNIAPGKNVDMSLYFNNKSVVNYGDGGISISLSPSYQAGQGSYQDLQINQDYTTWYINKHNQMYGWTTLTTRSSRRIFKVFWDNVANPFTLWRTSPKQPNDKQLATMIGNFASPLTNNYRMPVNFGDYSMLVANEIVEDKQQVFGAVLANVSGEMNYRYGSVNGHAFLGYAPNLDRRSLRSLGKPEALVQCLLNEGDAQNSLVSQARFPFKSTRFTSPRLYRVDANLNGDGSISVASGVLESLDSQLRTLLSSRGIGLAAESANSTAMLFELVLPQIYGDCPAFVFGSYIRSDRMAFEFVCSVNIGGIRSAVTGASLDGASFVSEQNVITGASAGISVANFNEVGQTCIRRVNGGFVLGIHSPFLTQLTRDNQNTVGLVRYIAGSGWRINGTFLWNYYFDAATGFMNFPTKGLYMTQCSEVVRGEIDGGTKLLATLIATTDDPGDATISQTYLPRISQDAYSRVLLAQNVPSNWSIYITEETVGMINGKLGTMPKTRIDLNPATDASTTLYLWMVISGGVLGYSLQRTANTPSGEDPILIGTIVTGAEGINVISVEKKTALRNIVLSRTSRGSAFPVTSGTPNQAGKLNWK